MSKKSLYTIGYEGTDIDDFIDTLETWGIQQLIDIRELPLSRKRGFSKNLLRSALAERDIAYLHIKALGDPKPGRDAARSGDFVTFRRLYRAHLKLKDSQEALVQTSKAAKLQTSALLCFEADYRNCHRSIVASSISKSHSFSINHISVEKASITKSKYRDDRSSNFTVTVG